MDLPTSDEPHGANPSMQGQGRHENMTEDEFVRVVDAFKRACLRSTEDNTLQPPTPPASGWNQNFLDMRN